MKSDNDERESPVPEPAADNAPQTAAQEPAPEIKVAVEAQVAEPAIDTPPRARGNRANEAPAPDSHEEGDTDFAPEEVTAGVDDPLAPAYDLEHGELLEPAPASRNALPWSSRVQNAKEFFSSEMLYRYDLLEREQQKELKGRYRVELRGFKGGVWTIEIDNELGIVNRREDAEVVLSMQQRDFLQLVNGDLNPQLAILSQKMRVQGDVRRAIALQAILVPSVD